VSAAHHLLHDRHANSQPWLANQFTEEVASVDLTMTEVAAAFRRVMGKQVAYQQIPFEAFEQQAGEAMTTMYRWFEKVGYGADLVKLKRDFPEPTDLEAYLRDHDWAKPSESASA
jgi:hypothetical protein